jgi:hypothetical protein
MSSTLSFGGGSMGRSMLGSLDMAGSLALG